MPTLRSSLAAAATAALLLVPSTAGAQPLGAALDRVVAAGAPGAVALADGRTVTSGVADVRTGRPLRATDPMRIGSVTKSFTAVAALQLVGEGRLRLDDTVGQRLPGVLPYGDAITLRELLDHTSGVPEDVGTPLRELFHGDPFRLWTPAETVGLVRDQAPRFPAGTGWAYSNTDYVLVGMMIERVTGHSLAHELGRRIVRPLGLRHTSFPVRSGPRAPHGYSLDLGPDGPIEGTLRDLTHYSPSFAWAGGNGVSTVRDVARFYRALLRGRLLAPRLLHAALSGVETGKPGRRFGLGLELRDTPYGTLAGHEGDIPGFSIKALSSLDGQHQAVVAINLKFAPPSVDDAFDAAGDAAAGGVLRSSSRVASADPARATKRRTVGSMTQGNITPIQAAENPIDPGVRIGHVHLRTADIDRVRDFYVGVLGFDVVAEARAVPGWGTTGDVLFVSAGGYHHHLGFNTWKSAGGDPQPDGVTGLHHVALNYPTRARLADAVRRLQAAGVPLRQLSDHGTHEAVYLSDPDGNDLELAWDRPMDQWPHSEEGGLAPIFGELDLDDLLLA